MSLPFLRTPRQLLSHSSPSTHLSCCFSLVRTPPPSLLRPHSLAPRAPPPLPSWSFRPFLVSTRVSQHARPARRFRNLRNAGKRGCSRGEFAYRPCSYMFVLNRLCVRQSQCGVSRCSTQCSSVIFFPLLRLLTMPFPVSTFLFRASLQESFNRCSLRVN